MKRAFHATSVDIDPASEFVGFTAGDGYFWLQREEKSEELKPALGNIWIECDAQNRGGSGGLESLELRPGGLLAKIDLGAARFMAPNDEIEVTFDDADGSHHTNLLEALTHITRGYENVFSVVAKGGKAKVVPAKPLRRDPELPRVKGAAALTLKSPKTQNWSAAVGEEIDLAFTVESQGGPVRGLSIEIGGPAVADGVVDVVSVQNARVPASPFAKTGAIAKATLPHVRLKAGFAPADANRHYDGRQPSADLAVRLRVAKASIGMLTVRVTPQNAADGARGSALQGRAFRGT